MLKKVGAFVTDNGAEFRVWAPQAKKIEVLLPHAVELKPEENGYFYARVENVSKGQMYKFRLDGKEELPDPASRFQPEGVHGPSEIVDREFPWTDQAWGGPEFDELVIYELHVGTFTKEGTFSAIIDHLPRLKDLGVTALELMPVAQFPGKRNWGYDGVNLFAPQNSYAAKNSPEELKNLINECHRQGLAIFLDVVYNHLGPEGNHLAKWGPYFQDKYRTPWGNALNFDGAHSDEVRNYFLNNAQQWIEEYHFDGLRFDAIHAIMDTSAYPFLAEVTDLIKELRQKLDRKIWTIAESDGNDPRVLQDSAGGGFGMDAQWADDFHHCMHAYLTEEKQGYYSDYGTAENLAEVFKKGTLFSGQYSKARGRRHGRSFSPEQRHRLVVCSQNHDQVGNRARGERLAHLIDENKLKAAAIWTFLFGGLPMLFMGEEIGADRPFQYFVDHTENELLTAVREGRKKEFAAFTWQGEVPDPGALSTFENSRPDWSGLESQRSREFLALHKNLTALSKKLRKSKILEDKNLNVELLNEGKVLQVRVPGFFEMLGSLTMEEQQISRTERQLPLSFSSIKNFEIGPKIKLPSFAVAVFYE